jgi:prepilin-type N-terminal cleavage/methylation domain-containing protein
MRGMVNARVSSLRRGFTLTEIAIVLGVIGLILGAIWVAASSAYRNLKITNAPKQIMIIVQNVRSLYASQPGFAASDIDTYMTGPMISAGVFPSDLVVGSNAVDAWGGGVNVWVEDPNNFWVVYTALPPSDCIALASAVMASSSGSELVCTQQGVNCSYAPTFTVAWAAANCGITGPLTDFEFSLK